MDKGIITKLGYYINSIFNLLDSIDSFVDEPKRETNLPFLMAIEDVFSIPGRGTVATGRIEPTLPLVQEIGPGIGPCPAIENRRK